MINKKCAFPSKTRKFVTPNFWTVPGEVPSCRFTSGLSNPVPGEKPSCRFTSGLSNPVPGEIPSRPGNVVKASSLLVRDMRGNERHKSLKTAIENKIKNSKAWNAKSQLIWTARLRDEQGRGDETWQVQQVEVGCTEGLVDKTHQTWLSFVIVRCKKITF